MLSDFLGVLRPVLQEEVADYRAVCAALTHRLMPVHFMPSVTFDLWPVYCMQCTAARQYADAAASGDAVYIVSTGAHDFFFQPMLERLVRGFYLEDEADFPLTYGGELDQMLLLSFEPIERTLDPDCGLQAAGVNVVYMSFDMPGGSAAHLFFVLGKTLETWKAVFEAYDIPCGALLDSHKGLGDWFYTIDLYAHYAEAAKPALRPRLYFKGKYIGCMTDGIEDFALLHRFEESRPSECESQLYRTSYHS